MNGFVTRRRLLWTVAGATGSLVIAGASSGVVCNHARNVTERSVQKRLVGTLPEVFEPERLARHWRDSVGHIAPVDEILGRPGLVAALDAACVGARRTLVRAQFAEDFAAGDVVVADRLLVARSEYLISAVCINAVLQV